MENNIQPQLIEAILKVGLEVRNIEKNMTVGKGYNSYDAVSDGDVRDKIGTAMFKHGLSIVPIGQEAGVDISRWEDNGKSKQSVFTEVSAKYLLVHESGGWITCSGYGQGLDPSDKGAGKATTYALKNLLLDLFLVKKGEAVEYDLKDTVPPVSSNNPSGLVKLVKGSDNWKKVTRYLDNNPRKSKAVIIKDLEKKYLLTKTIKNAISNYNK